MAEGAGHREELLGGGTLNIKYMGSLTAAGSFHRALRSICGPAPGGPVVL